MPRAGAGQQRVRSCHAIGRVVRRAPPPGAVFTDANGRKNPNPENASSSKARSGRKKARRKSKVFFFKSDITSGLVMHRHRRTTVEHDPDARSTGTSRNWARKYIFNHCNNKNWEFHEYENYRRYRSCNGAVWLLGVATVFVTTAGVITTASFNVYSRKQPAVNFNRRWPPHPEGPCRPNQW